MKMMYAALCCLLLAACRGFISVEVPFAITKPQCVIGGNEDYYAIAGIVFTVYNTGGKDIERLEVSCMVFDEETKRNPFIGSNLLQASFYEGIGKGEKKELILPLDRYIYRVPERPYIIDHFFVKKIVFTDGSVWEDVTGAYKI